MPLHVLLPTATVHHPLLPLKQPLIATLPAPVHHPGDTGANKRIPVVPVALANQITTVMHDYGIVRGLVIADQELYCYKPSI